MRAAVMNTLEDNHSHVASEQLDRRNYAYREKLPRTSNHVHVAE